MPQKNNLELKMEALLSEEVLWVELNVHEFPPAVITQTMSARPLRSVITVIVISL